ncbi:CoA transferase [Mycolicibacillus parakoreensis]|uniref:CoA transferase n=1 Tax=Mycolicibacillus parakoreensis TaxID=1069221 RepID=A0ABY3U6S3_9MYCO|nr:CoA transferase [Mycolicibacillus parakoreensis]MCV7317527.1 CoA transferase [Mycolicibacillus parakoreensis]ULN54241.1 CoA transferase [Mycolicibacillus parakoreensis]
MLLEAVRVLEVAESDGAAAVSRLFADLGADVLKVEPPGGSADRTERPTVAGVSIPFAVHNANKRGVALDPRDPADRRRFAELAATADVLVDSGRPGRAAQYGASAAELVRRHRQLVAVTLTPFGATGPRAHWQATDAVFYALSGALSRSGPTAGTPVLPPAGIASSTAALQACWATLVAYYHRLGCGVGDFLDFSRFDAVATGLDPVFGTHGQTAAARRGPQRWRGRPKNQDAYPIFACADGHVRICVMSPRQWHGLRAWLGEPARFQSAEFDRIGARFAAWPQIAELVADLFAAHTMAELVDAGQAHRVPIAAVLSPAQVLTADHFTAVGAISDTELAPGLTVPAPVGYFRVDGRRAGWRTPAPTPTSGGIDWAAPTPTDTSAHTTDATEPKGPEDATGYPFAGLRVIDLGIIVAGGETSRLFADLGAQVIKVESRDHPDGLRQARPGQPMSESFAWAHRNSLGLGLDLRRADGAALFARLVADADVLLANFKPGTLAGLGFDASRLRALNPNLVVAESSAFGDTGPWSGRMGYGPLVRATTGVTQLWTAPDGAAPADRHPFYDATTIFPDHVAGRVTAIGALAALIDRRRGGGGHRVHVAQTEIAINQLAPHFVAAGAGTAATVEAATGVDVVCAAAGDDEWCVISVRSDADWQRLATLIGRPELADDARFTGAARPAHREALTDTLTAWTRDRDPLTAATAVQRAGLAAAPMNRPPDVAEDPQLRHRAVFTEMPHPLFDHPLPAETGPAPFHHIPPAPQRPAPQPGQHTRQICTTVLGLTDAEIDRLLTDGALFAADPAEIRSPSRADEVG